MTKNFMLFSDLQKKVTTSPIKTWRLLKVLRDQGQMKVDDDWMMIDRKLFVNVPRFVVELEQMGYAVKSDDIKNDNVISDDFKKLYDEMRLISDEITSSRIQEEMKSSDMKDVLNKADVKSSEINDREPVPRSDGISVEVKSSEINLKSPEFNLLLRSKDEIIASKKEQIEDMKEMYTEILVSKDHMLKSKDDQLKEVRSALDTVVKQNETLVHQNVYLTRLLTAPKADRSEQERDDVISPDFSDVSHTAPDEEAGGAHMSESDAMAAHDTGIQAESGAGNHRTAREVPIESDHVDGDESSPTDYITSV
jgi:hypothetical protein